MQPDLSSLSDPPLWRRLGDFPLDSPDSSYRFSDRLAVENGWSARFTLRVMDEYRRFVYLAMTAGHSVSPSDAVDQAWHLHLIYTRSYWDDLCRDVLGRPFHHEPSTGGSRETSKFDQWYQQTLDRYRVEFQGDPPSDIWPPPRTNAQPPSRHRRVNLCEFWLLPKPHSWGRIGRRPGMARATWIGLVAAVAPWGAITPLDLPGPEFLKLFAAVLATAILAGIALRCKLRQPVKSSTDEVELSVAELACLAGGRTRVAQSVIAALFGRGILQAYGTKSWFGIERFHLRVADDVPPTHDPFEQQVIDAVRRRDGRGAEVISDLELHAARIETVLQQQGLLESPESFRLARWLPVTIMVGVVTFGVAKLVMGLSRDKPVGFLVLLLCVAISALIAFCLRPYRTHHGDRLLRELQSRHRELKSVADTPDGRPFLPMAVALFGTTPLASAPYENLRNAIHAGTNDATSGIGGLIAGGCGGSGCGGSGCGGGGCGGGGCGGCGG